MKTAQFSSAVKRRWTFLAILAGPLILVGLPLLQGKVLIWGTPSMQFIPWWTEACRQLAEGRLPLWNALSGMGAPLLANYQSAFFYPPNWLLYPVGLLAGAQGLALGFTFLAMAHLFWAGWGGVMLLRRLGTGELGQVIGGMAFSLSGYLIARLEFFSIIWTAAWFPWIILAASTLAGPHPNLRAVQRFTISIPLLFVTVMMLLAGHAQLSWYIGLFAAAWVTVGTLREKGKISVWPFLSLAATGLAGAILAAVQLAPTAEYLILSDRAGEYGYSQAVTYSFWPWRLVTLLAPDFFGNPGLGDYWGYASYWEDAIYIGIIPLFLAISSLNRLWHKHEGGAPQRLLASFLWGSVVVSFILALGKNTPIFPFLYQHVPTFDMFQAPARFLIWAVFALSLLAAMAADQWQPANGRKLYWLRLGTAGAFAVTLGAGLAWYSLQNIELTFIRATALAGFWALGAGGLSLVISFFERRGKRQIWIGMVVGWILLDLLVANLWLNPFTHSSFYAGTNLEVTSLKTELAGRRVYMPERVESLLKFRRFFRAGDYRPVAGWGDLRRVMLPNLNLLDGIPSANNFDPLVPARYARWVSELELQPDDARESWLRLAGAGAIVRIDVPSPGGVKYELIENPQKRFSIHACPIWVTDEITALEEYGRTAANPDRLVLEGVASQDPCSPVVTGYSRLLEFHAGEIRLETPAESVGGWIFVDESWYPGWNAWIDGEKAEVLRANYLFMAVAVPAGYHEVKLEYQANSFIFGALFSILVLISGWLYARHRKKQPAV